MNTLCSHDRLEQSLAGLLNTDDESALSRHLDECAACSAEIERLAGGQRVCQEIATMLAPDDLDDALPLREECSTADFVVDHLEPSADPAVLGCLGSYDVLEIIGRGGMGVVLKGYDRELKRFVAIKALAPHLAHSALARKRFAREAQAAAAVVNLHVIAIHQVQPNGQLPFLVMPLLNGESLAQRMTARGTLELKEVLRIGMQAAEGLAAAHSQGLIHRDIKPANILLEKGVERAVLTDFGFARAADDVSMTRAGIIAGTPEYMSPEQARGEALDGRSDLFSLGCVLYEMATGVSPFRADSTMATLRRIVDEKPVAMASHTPDLPPWFIGIVERLLSKDPAQRFASAREVSELLEQCLSHLQQPATVSLPAAAKTSTAGRRGRPSRLRWLVAAAAAFTWLFAGIFIVLELNKGQLTIECAADDVPVRILQSDTVVKTLTVTREGATVRVAAGNYVVEIDGATDGIIVQDGAVTLKRGGVETVRIVNKPAATAKAIDRTNAREVVEAYMALALAGDLVKAGALEKGGNRKEPKQIETIARVLTVKKLAIKTVNVNESAALAVSEAVRIEEKPGRTLDGFLVFTLVLSEREWFVNDIDFESQEGVDAELRRFLAAHPNATVIPQQARTGFESISPEDVAGAKAAGAVDRTNARAVVEAYVARALAGELAQAGALAQDNPKKPEQIESIARMLNVKRLAIKTVNVDEAGKPSAALAVSEAVRMEEKPGRKIDGFLVFTLVLNEGEWFVKDIDFESQEGADAELMRFLEARPKTAVIPLTGGKGYGSIATPAKLPDVAYTTTGIHCQKFREEDAKRPGGELMGDVVEPQRGNRGKYPLILGMRVASDAQWNIGGQARVELVVRNAGGSDVKFVQTPRADNGLSVVAIDKDGKEHQAEIAQFDSWLVFNHLLLPRAHMVTVKSFTLRFDPEKRDVSEPGVAAFHLPPGDYTLRCIWNDARTEVAHEGEWTGALASAKHKFRLAAAVAMPPASETPKTPVGGEPRDPK